MMKKRLNVNWHYVAFGIAFVAMATPEIYLAIWIIKNWK